MFLPQSGHALLLSFLPFSLFKNSTGERESQTPVSLGHLNFPPNPGIVGLCGQGLALVIFSIFWYSLLFPHCPSVPWQLTSDNNCVVSCVRHTGRATARIYVSSPLESHSERYLRCHLYLQPPDWSLLWTLERKKTRISRKKGIFLEEALGWEPPYYLKTKPTNQKSISCLK